MECEPFLPLSRVNWVTTKGTLLQLQSKVCTLRLNIPQIHTWFKKSYPRDIHFYHSLVSAPNLKVPTITTPVTGTNYPFYSPPGQTNMQAVFFVCLDTEAVLTLALVKPQCTKSTMPNIYNLYKNSTSPYWPPQDENR